MTRAVQCHGKPGRTTQRAPLHALVELTNGTGERLAPLARCTEIGLGGLRVVAPHALQPGTRIHLRIRLPSGALVESCGTVAWSRETVRPALLGPSAGADDDACFGIAFDGDRPERLAPIARLLAARGAERRRARRLRRLHGLPLPA